MNQFRLIALLNNDEIFITGIAHHTAIDRRMGVIAQNLIKEIADEISAVDGFHNFDDEFALFFCYYIFWQMFSKKYNSLIESHRNGNTKRYPM
jgi:hypothetical protein